MKILSLLVLIFSCAGFVSQAAECPQKDDLEKQEKRLAAYTPPAPAQASASGPQGPGMGTHVGNTSVAGKGAGNCASVLGVFSSDFKKLKREMKGNQDCEDEISRADAGMKSAARRAGECKSAQDALKSQEDKSKGNENKMGDEKKGGGGSPPQMPQIPEKKDDKKKQEDPIAKEKERQAKIAACKASVNINLEIKKKNCEINFSFDPNHPVTEMKKKQDECKQTEIFASQESANQCETFYAVPTAQ